MIRDRYAPYSLFDAVPQLQLWFEPELAARDRRGHGVRSYAAVRRLTLRLMTRRLMTHRSWARMPSPTQRSRPARPW